MLSVDEPGGQRESLHCKCKVTRDTQAELPAGGGVLPLEWSAPVQRPSVDAMSFAHPMARANAMVRAPTAWPALKPCPAVKLAPLRVAPASARLRRDAAVAAEGRLKEAPPHRVLSTGGEIRRDHIAVFEAMSLR